MEIRYKDLKIRLMVSFKWFNQDIQEYKEILLR